MSDEAIEPIDKLFGDDVTEEPTEAEPTELTEDEGDTADEAQPVEETEVDESDDLEGAQDEAPEKIEDEPSETDDQDADASDEEELYFDLDGEEVSLSQAREWKNGHMLEKKFTQLRQEDAKRETRNKDAEQIITAQADRVSAIAESGEKFLESLKSEGLLNDEDLTKFTTQLDGLKTQLIDDRVAAMTDFANQEGNMLLKRNKSWVKNGELTEQFKTDKALTEGYLLGEGYSQEEMSLIVDHRMRIAFFKAAKYDALQHKRVKTKQKLKSVPLKAKPKPKPKAEAPPKDAEESVFGAIH